MLLKEQVRELLRRCEKISGNDLKQLKGNLKQQKTRASAIWELLCIDAFSSIGKVQYEPLEGGSPDIYLQFSDHRSVWIEAAFLYPRYPKIERQSQEVVKWLFSESRRRGIPPYKIFPRLDGIKERKGYIRNLPQINEQRKFINSPEVITFFEEILKHPGQPILFQSSWYTMSVEYNPKAQGPYLSSGGLAQEAPTDIRDHALFRLLKDKAKQHSINEPRIICVGSDQSHALAFRRGPNEVGIDEVFNRIFKNNSSISGIYIVKIENIPEPFTGFKKVANKNLIMNPNSTAPLTKKEISALNTVDFKKWKYSFPIKKWKDNSSDIDNSITGNLVCSYREHTMTIEVPTTIVIKALLGKSTLVDSYQIKENEHAFRALRDKWEIESCRFILENIEKAEASKICFDIGPPFETDNVGSEVYCNYSENELTLNIPSNVFGELLLGDVKISEYGNFDLDDTCLSVLHKGWAIISASLEKVKGAKYLMLTLVPSENPFSK